MRLKIHTFIGVFGWSLAILAASLPVDSMASGEHMTTADRRVYRQPAIRAISYRAPVYAAYARPVVKDSDTLSVSVVPEVDTWTMLVAILGLISMRLWRSGKKNLLVIK